MSPLEESLVSLPLIAESDLVKAPDDLAQSGCSPADPDLDDRLDDSLPKDLADDVNGTHPFNQTEGDGASDIDNFELDPEPGSGLNNSNSLNNTLKGEEVDSFAGLVKSSSEGLAHWLRWVEHQVAAHGIWLAFGLCLVLILVLYVAWGWMCCQLSRTTPTTSRSGATTTPTPDQPTSAEASLGPQLQPQPQLADPTPSPEVPPPVDDPNVFALADMVPSGSVSDCSVVVQPSPPLDTALTTPALGSFNHRRPASLNLVADYPLEPPADVEAQATLGRILCTSL